MAEVLVTIAILATLVGLLLPAIQYARAAAKAMMCSHRLRQQALAVHHSEQSWQKLPRLCAKPFDAKGRPAPRGLEPSDLASLGWRTGLLPYLEQWALFGQLNFQHSALHHSHRVPLSAVLEVFQCPATPGSGRQVSLADRKWGAADYQAPEFVDRSECAWASISGDARDAGGSSRWQMFGNSAARLADVEDGLSHTVLIFEQAGQPNVYFGTGELIENAQPLALGAWSMAGGRSLRVAADGNNVNRENILGVFAFHSGGANAAMGDGSVRFLSESLSVFAYRALFTRAEREPPQ